MSIKQAETHQPLQQYSLVNAAQMVNPTFSSSDILSSFCN
jgi:hypothetical protein